MVRTSNFMTIFRDQKNPRTCFCRLFPAVSILFLLVFLWSSGTAQFNKESNYSARLSCRRFVQKLLRWNLQGDISNFTTCKDQCRPPGSETLPKGIVAKTSNLERRPLWGSPKEKASQNLFAAAVGIKQKETVDKMVQKFLESNFVVMLFHYDGIVDGWKDFEWSRSVIHISADNQTKWWFAKRFLHPDIVAAYAYVFLWDEDLGVENFDPERYLSIVKDEGLEISQPALETGSEVHHLITARHRRSNVHRRTYKRDGKGVQCDGNSSAPPCTGWIEVMAPVFSKAAWRCVWYMMQNDLIHAWGLDMRLGYCAQGDRTRTIGVVDAEYVVHYGLPTLGEPSENKVSSPNSKMINQRIEVRRQSYNEYKVFQRRWKRAVEADKSWTDPYPEERNQSSLWPLM